MLFFSLLLPVDVIAVVAVAHSGGSCGAESGSGMDLAAAAAVGTVLLM